MKSILTEKWLVCRICLKQKTEAMQSIFNDNMEKDLTRMILECGGVPIKRFDHYPDKICNVCFGNLHVAHKFRSTCQRSHNHLSRFIAPVEIEKNEYTMNLEDTVDTEYTISTDAAETTTSSYTIDIKTESIPKNDHQHPTAHGNNEELTMHEMAESDYYDDVVEFYEPVNEVLDLAVQSNDEGGELSVDYQDQEGEVEYLEMENEEELSTSDEEYKPPASVLSSIGKKRPRGRPAKKATAAKKTQKRTTKMIINTEIDITATESNNSVLKRIKRTTGTVPKKCKVIAYICDFCGNKYPTQGRLTEHIKLHKGIKPHECEICGHAFAQTQQLARHMNTHTGNRPYKCQYCPAAFADLSTRNKHHRIHTNERPYSCDVCGKTFTYTNTLKFHKMIHTGEKPFVCNICGKGFQQAYKLRSHKQIHEKQKNFKVDTLSMEMGEGDIVDYNSVELVNHENTEVFEQIIKTEMA